MASQFFFQNLLNFWLR